MTRTVTRRPTRITVTHFRCKFPSSTPGSDQFNCRAGFRVTGSPPHDSVGDSEAPGVRRSRRRSRRRSARDSDPWHSHAQAGPAGGRGSIQKTYQLHTIHINYTQLHSEYIQYTYKLHTEYIPFTYNVHSIHIKYIQYICHIYNLQPAE